MASLPAAGAVGKAGALPEIVQFQAVKGAQKYFQKSIRKFWTNRS
jgi:hypothetical protein